MKTYKVPLVRGRVDTTRAGIESVPFFNVTPPAINQWSKFWCAVISPEVGAPGGMRREWVKRGSGAFIFILDARIYVGAALEFGVDFALLPQPGGQVTSRQRYYCVVTHVEHEFMTLKMVTGARKAIEESKKVKPTSVGERLKNLKNEGERLAVRLREVAAEIAAIEENPAAADSLFRLGGDTADFVEPTNPDQEGAEESGRRGDQ